MDLSTRHATVAREALDRMGYSSLDQLSHSAQHRFAHSLGMDLPDLHRSLRSNDARGARPGRAQSMFSRQQARAVSAEREAELAALRAGRDGDDLTREMLCDEKVWAEVARAAAKLGIARDSRAATYRSVTRQLDELRRRWLAHDEKVSSTTNEWVRRTKRSIRAVERAYADARSAQTQTLVGLDRQAAAARGAARMRGR